MFSLPDYFFTCSALSYNRGSRDIRYFLSTGPGSLDLSPRRALRARLGLNIRKIKAASNLYIYYKVYSIFTKIERGTCDYVKDN